MGAKRISEHDLVFTGRNVPLSEIARASGSGEGKQHRYYCPDRVVYLKTGYFNPKPQQTNEEV